MDLFPGYNLHFVNLHFWNFFKKIRQFTLNPIIAYLRTNMRPAVSKYAQCLSQDKTMSTCYNSFKCSLTFPSKKNNVQFQAQNSFYTSFETCKFKNAVCRNSDYFDSLQEFCLQSGIHQIKKLFDINTYIRILVTSDDFLPKSKQVYRKISYTFFWYWEMRLRQDFSEIRYFL